MVQVTPFIFTAIAILSQFALSNGLNVPRKPSDLSSNPSPCESPCQVKTTMSSCNKSLTCVCDSAIGDGLQQCMSCLTSNSSISESDAQSVINNWNSACHSSMTLGSYTATGTVTTASGTASASASATTTTPASTATESAGTTAPSTGIETGTASASGSETAPASSSGTPTSPVSGTGTASTTGTAAASTSGTSSSTSSSSAASPSGTTSAASSNTSNMILCIATVLFGAFLSF